MSTSVPPSDDEFLDDLFDEAVRAREAGRSLDVDAHLHGREHLRARADGLLALAGDIAVAAPMRPRYERPTIAGYVVHEEIGRGGGGLVYRARQESLGRDVALKVLSPSLVISAHARERFAAEARSLGRLRHAHIVTVHDVIATPDLCAYAMEWVDGTTLARAVAAGDARLDVIGVARIGVAVARALQAVHDASLVHRDVKPSNVLLRADGTPLLSDFGLVHDPEHSMHTATGQFVGTAAFAAPEQLRGEHARVGPTTDVYGLGVTLFVALTGQTPFAATTTAGMLQRIEAGAPTPIQRLNPRVPRDFATIVSKAMDRDPDRRYARASDLADDLERFLSFQPIHARPAGLALRVQRWLERSPQLALALAALLVTFGLGLGASIYLAFDLAHQRNAAQAAEKRAELESDNQRQIADFMRFMVRGAEATSYDGKDNMTVRQAIERAYAELERRADYRPDVEVELRLLIAELSSAFQGTEQARKNLARATELARGTKTHRLAEALLSLGRTMRGKDPKGSQEPLREAVRLRRQAVAGEPGKDNELLLAQALNGLGITLRLCGDGEGAVAAYSEALTLYERHLPSGAPDIGSTLANLATALTQLGRHDEALRHCQRGVEIARQFHAGQPHLDVVASLFNLAGIHWNRGTRAEALAIMREGLAMNRAAVGDKHDSTAHRALRLATHLVQERQNVEAEALLREALAVFVAREQTDGWTRASLALGDLLLATDRPAEAEAVVAPLLDQLLVDPRLEKAASVPQRAAMRCVGVARCKLGRHAEAEAVLQGAWTALDAGATRDERVAIATALAECYAGWHHSTPSQENSERAAQWRQKLNELAASR